MAYYRDSVTEGSYFEDEEDKDEGAASFRARSRNGVYNRGLRGSPITSGFVIVTSIC